jgi:hypothetical protein
MKPQLIDDNDIDVEDLNFDIDFTLSGDVFINWQGKKMQLRDDLPEGVL